MKNLCKKKFLIVLIFLFAQQLFAQAPTITSFSPTSGPVGTTVTITGTNFSTIAANNIVYFGAVRANITNANNTTLNVIVPAGASYLPITVTVNGFAAYSGLPFDVTFNNAAGSNITSASFNKINITSPTSGLEVVGDIDGDGKPDIVSLSPYDNVISILRNSSFQGSPVFLPVANSYQSDYYGIVLTLADIDGDGKLDILLANFSSNNTISIFRNTSTPGNISFATKVDIPTPNGVESMAINDIDGDGKPDLIIGVVYYNIPNYSVSYDSLCIYRNVSVIGNITSSSFAPRIDFSGYPLVAVSDIDGDGKPDIAASNGTQTIMFFRNISTPGTINTSSLSAPQYFQDNYNVGNIIAVDIDGDGKNDLVTQDAHVLKNNTVLNDTFSFSKSISFVPDNILSPYSYCALPGDLDGDGKPDLVLAVDTGKIVILKNISTPGSITDSSFVLKVVYNVNTDVQTIAIDDVDGDGKPDIVALSYFSSGWVFRNQINETIKANLCPPIGNTVIISDSTGSSYQWQLSTDGNNFNNISNNSNYAGVNSDTLNLNNIPSSWYGYQFRCNVNETNSSVYTLKFTDTWIGTTDSTWENAANWSCGTLPDSNTDVIINSGTVVLKSNAMIRSITVSPSASFTVATGFNLTVTH